MKTLKYSRQRESIKACLMGRRIILQPMPCTPASVNSFQISVSETVYRNLNLLVELGEIRKFSCGDGTDHFDYDTSPHYHYVCRKCGRILDLPMAAEPALEDKARACLDGTVEEHTVFFYGTCGECLRNDTH